MRSAHRADRVGPATYYSEANRRCRRSGPILVSPDTAPRPYPDKYDLLMDIATEELSHLEIVGATITMLLDGVNGELKNAAESHPIMNMLKGNTAKEELIHAA